MPGTFESDMDGTFESDMDGTFKVMQSDETGRRRNWRIESAIAVLDDDNVSGRIFSNEVHAIYRRELARMPRLTRDIFLASREYGRTYQEIAVMYGIKVRKVTAEMQRALAILRKALKDYL